MKLSAQALPVEGDPLFNAVGRFFTFRHDLFFSCHTAVPFLGFLLFRDRWARAVSLSLSLLLAAAVLLARQHYSIDVFGAYFITYALYSALPASFRETGRGDESRLDFAPLGVYATGEEA
jgi:hypothetical protein